MVYVTHLRTGVTMTESASLVTMVCTSLLLVRASRQVQVPWSPTPTSRSRSQLGGLSGLGSIVTWGFVTEQSSSGFPFSMSRWIDNDIDIEKRFKHLKDLILLTISHFTPALSLHVLQPRGDSQTQRSQGLGAGHRSLTLVPVCTLWTRRKLELVSCL